MRFLVIIKKSINFWIGLINSESCMLQDETQWLTNIKKNIPNSEDFII